MTAALGLSALGLGMGCGTTRTSNTLRTATEQLLISDAIDRSVQLINFQALAGETVFFDERHLHDVVDNGYLISSLRQHLLASGCILKMDRNEATYVVEPRAGAVGTDNHDLLFGMPATSVPQVALLQALPPAIPEIPIAKRRDQRGIAKIAVFAYRRKTGEPVWQSGIASSESTANNIWILGAGPFKRGTIYEGTSFAGRKISGAQQQADGSKSRQVVQLNQEAIFRKQTPDAIENSIVKSELQQDDNIQQATAITSQVQAETPTKDTPPAHVEQSLGSHVGPTVIAPPSVLNQGAAQSVGGVVPFSN